MTDNQSGPDRPITSLRGVGPSLKGTLARLGIFRTTDLLLHLPIRYQDRPHGLIVLRDISQRKEQEEDLRRSEGRLRATVEAALDAVIGMDAAGNIIEFNAAAERCFGHHRADVLGKSLAELVIPRRHRRRHTAPGMEQAPARDEQAPGCCRRRADGSGRGI